MNETNIQTWECGAENASDVIATLEGTTLIISGEGEMYDECNAPWYKRSITSIVIKNGVTNIGSYVFRDCYGLTSVIIPSSVVNIGNYAFSNCSGLTSVIIPCNVTNIGDHAFDECNGLISILIPEHVTNIGDCAFMDCSELSSVIISNSVMRIGTNAFFRCRKLSSITIPNSVTTIGSGAFGECSSASSIIIGHNVTSLGNNVFEGCKPTSIINLNPAPQVIDIRSGGLFGKINTIGNIIIPTAPLYVNESVVNVYKRAPFWKLFKTIHPINDDSFALCKTTEQIDEEILLKQQEINNLKQEIEKFRQESEQKIEISKQEIKRLEFKKILLRGIAGNPKHVAQFMSLFNQRDGLKYLTHDFDESGEFDRKSFLEQIRKVCTENFEQLEIPQTLKELINQFAFEKEPKWMAFDNQYNPKEITSGWSAPEWEETKAGKLHPIRLSQFAEIIKDFKRTTRIESPNLDVLIKKVFADESFEIEKKDLSKADFYTHVGEFKSALETIFEEIQKRSDTPDKKKVSVEYKKRFSDEYAVREIIISHHNSFPTRDDENNLIKEWLSLEKGNMGKIAKHLQGYCYWSVVTKINDKPMKVNILREKDTPEQEEVDATVATGFTHILTFYHQS